VEIKRVVDFEHALHGYMRANQKALMDKINASPDYNDEIAAALRAAIEDFKANNTW
jgi:F-type H+-transporting ATPase subunit alpha